jgi:predicted dehydrogenase
VVGLLHKGGGHVQRFHSIPGVEVVALADVDEAVLRMRADKFDRRMGGKAELLRDMRHLLERDDIHAISIATPNHWHVLQGIWCCQAGKPVYVEKPVCHNVWEGRQLIRAGEKYGVVTQAGTHCRSDDAPRAAFKYLQSGALGKILYVHGVCYRHRKSIGKRKTPLPVPESIDYDLWCGPAAKEPLWRNELHYDWHWVWNTGNGDIGNQGVHEMDLCRWALGESGLPRRVFSAGGRYGWNDAGETANTQVAVFDYETAPLIFEVRNLPRKPGAQSMDHYRGTRVGLVVQCEGGYFAGNPGGWVYDNKGQKIKQFISEGADRHFPRFIESIREGKLQYPGSSIEECHISSSLCHLANISYRLGRETPVEEVKASLPDKGDARETLGRILEHLARHGIDLNQHPLTLGPCLEVDPERECFRPGPLADRANALLKREYREPYVVPEIS